jgi:hypothetical protein
MTDGDRSTLTPWIRQAYSQTGFAKRAGHLSSLSFHIHSRIVPAATVDIERRDAP